jgi:hypothetical protein
MFLRSMKPKALQKWAQHPGLFDREAMLRARDSTSSTTSSPRPCTASPATEDYWSRASAKPHLHRIRIPALALNALQRPFVPAASLPRPQEISPWVTLWQPREGGHVGFPSGSFPGHVLAMPEAVTAWLLQAAGIAHPRCRRGGTRLLPCRLPERRRAGWRPPGRERPASVRTRPRRPASRRRRLASRPP